MGWLSENSKSCARYTVAHHNEKSSYRSWKLIFMIAVFSHVTFLFVKWTESNPLSPITFCLLTINDLWQTLRPGMHFSAKFVESESGQMVSEKVKLTYFDVCLSQTMWNHTKSYWKGSNSNFRVFKGNIDYVLKLFAKNKENKENYNVYYFWTGITYPG